jgi:hypothetical protein
VYCRTDFRFGVDDPLQWPQPFTERFSHLAAILRSPPEDNHPNAAMHRFPPDRFFDKDRNNTTLVKFHPIWFEQLKDPCLKLLKRFRETPYYKEGANLMTQLAMWLQTLLDRLEFVTMDYPKMVTEVRETQRVFLELTACLDYDEIITKKADQVAGKPKKDPRRMGTFVDNADHCEMLFHAGLPVWFISPLHDLHLFSIDEVVNPLLPEGRFSIERRRDVCQIIYTGSTSSVAKQGAFYDHIMNHLQYSGPFGMGRVELRADPPAAQLPYRLDGAHHNRYTPCESLSDFAFLLLLIPT